MAVPYAFATLLTSDRYLPGALALAAALRDLHPSPAQEPEVDFQTVCLVTPETVDVSTIKLLRKTFNVVVGVEVITQEDDKGLQLLGRPDLSTVLTKLHVFRLTQYSKIIFLDADVLPIQPLSHLFTLPHEFSAVPDVGWPDIFNSGVMVLAPGQDKFEALNTLLKSRGTWDGGDQGILNEWRGPDWNRLSFTYNTTPTAAYTYAPAYERFGSQIKAIHFIGPDKPWNGMAYRAPFVAQHKAATEEFKDANRAYDYNSLLDRWYAVYDKHYRAANIIPERQFEVRRYVSAWDEKVGTRAELGSSTEVAAPRAVLGLEDLRRLALEGMGRIAGTMDTRGGEGNYSSLPLEGRVDLIRRLPSPPPPPVAQGASAPDQPYLRQEDANPASGDAIPASRGAIPSSGHAIPSSGHAIPSSGHAMPASRDTLPAGGDGGDAHHHTPSIPDPQAHQTERPDSSHTNTQHYPSNDSSSQTSTQIDHHDISDRSPQATALVTEQQHIHHQELQPQPPRPASPPKLSWNPAIEPPPNTAPVPNAFPADTYFPNIWDQSPSKRHDQSYQYEQNRPTSPTPDSGTFFQPPPIPEIPEQLRKQGHYRDVVGEATAGASPSPDRGKVKPVFPWEEQPRPRPGRVFPSYDAPSPSDFLTPTLPSQSSQEVQHIPSPEPPRSQPLSPLQGLPHSLNYANAWDTVPSIQKYANRLVRPPAPAPLAPAFDSQEWKRRETRSWDERLEASSRDGDDEDDGDEENEDQVSHKPGLWADDSDHETTSEKTRSRGSSVSSSYVIKGKKKEYRVRGVQTISPVMRSMGVQVSLGTSQPPRAQRPTVLPPASVNQMSGGPDVSMTTAFPSPVGGMRSPREFVFPETPASRQAPAAITPPPAAATTSTTESPGMIRQSSNDGSMASPPSSVGPLSPPDQPLNIASPMRKAGRVFDPARGVELFKRGSEEVLARFLKMSSWEEDASTH